MKSTTSRPRSAHSLLARWAETFRAVLNKLIPYGYEDDSGFHYADAPHRVRHAVRFHADPAPRHSRAYRTRRPQMSFHSYRMATREVPFE